MTIVPASSSCSARAPLLSRALFGTAAALLAVTLLGGCTRVAEEPAFSGVAPETRRITAEQYADTIHYLFGETIREAAPARMDPLVRSQGLLRLGAGQARFSLASLEDLYDLSLAIAEQVVHEDNRDFLIPCEPVAQNAYDESCAREFLEPVGSVLYRRPMSEGELDTVLRVVESGVADLGDFYEGLVLGLSSMLIAPQFLFITDDFVTGSGGQAMLDAYSRAARLSYFLWNAPPDSELLDAAQRGDLVSAAGLAAQIERMLASPRFIGGVRAFFGDLLHFEEFDTLEKDARIYPAFTPAVANDAREHMLRDLTWHLVDQRRDYRELFVTRETHISPSLARIYGVPFTSSTNDGWMRFEFPEGMNRAGLLTRVGFSALHAHPGRSSPTLRGMALREMFLCQAVPPPPADVDFTLFLDPNAPSNTARQRLDAHNTLPACTGCHLITDPIGLGLENFDGVGAFRTRERGEDIDVTGELDGIDFVDPDGLAAAVFENPSLVPCIVNRVVSYALGRAMVVEDQPLLDYFEERFRTNGYDFVELWRAVALSRAFFMVAPGFDEGAGVVTAAVDGR